MTPLFTACTHAASASTDKAARVGRGGSGGAGRAGRVGRGESGERVRLTVCHSCVHLTFTHLTTILHNMRPCGTLLPEVGDAILGLPTLDHRGPGVRPRIELGPSPQLVAALLS